MRYFLAIAIFLLLSAGSSAQTNVFCPQNANCTYTGNNTHSGTESFTGLMNLTNTNNILYISQFAGADLGAKMNAAINFCTVTLAQTACRYILDQSGTISTSPNFPIGSTIDCTANAPIALATTWIIQHRSVQFNGGGCQFNYTADNGGSAFLIYKNSTGTVNCNGTTTVSFASGTNFSNVDIGDQIAIAGALYNVIGVAANGQTLTTVATCPNQSGSAYSVILYQALFGNYRSSVTMRDFTIRYTGAGTTSSIGLNLQFVFDPLIENVKIEDFLGAQSTGFQASGVIDGYIYNLSLFNNVCQGFMQPFTSGGFTLPDAEVFFLSPIIINGGTCTSRSVAFQVLGANMTGIHFWQPDIENNQATYALYSGGGANHTVIREGFFQSNGDNTVNSADINFTSGYSNEVVNNVFTSAATNIPATGIICNGASTYCDVRFNTWDATPFYTTAWTYINGLGNAVGNNPSTVGHNDPAFVQDTVANVKLLSFNWTGASWGASAFHTGAVAGSLTLPNAVNLYAATAANNTLIPLLNLNASNSVIIDSGGQGVGFGGQIVPNNPGLQNIGTVALPWSSLFIGTAATNNFKFLPAATAAARTINIPDPLGNTNMVLTPAAGTIRNSLHISDQGTACANGNIALSGAWGTTAAATNARGQGQTCEWTITASGTGQAANPTITWTIPTALPSANVLCSGQVTGGSQATPSTIDHTTLSATAPLFTYNGTPTAAATLFVLLRCGP